MVSEKLDYSSLTHPLQKDERTSPCTSMDDGQPLGQMGNWRESIDRKKGKHNNKHYPVQWPGQVQVQVQCQSSPGPIERNRGFCMVFITLLWCYVDDSINYIYFRPILLDVLWWQWCYTITECSQRPPATVQNATWCVSERSSGCGLMGFFFCVDSWPIKRLYFY